MKKFVAHIRIEQHSNPEMRTYHANRLVSKQHMYDFGIDGMGNFNEEDPGEMARKLAKALEKVPGVSSGHLSAYEVDVSKGSAFEWDEVSPLVLGQLVKHIFPDFIGKEIQISTTLSTIDSGGFGQNHNFASRHPVLVKFGAKKRPSIDVEKLFKPQTLRKVVDNEPAHSTAGVDNQTVAPKKAANDEK